MQYNKNAKSPNSKSTIGRPSYAASLCSPGFHSPNRYESDLSYEVLYALVGKGAAKISEVKVGGQ